MNASKQTLEHGEVTVISRDGINVRVYTTKDAIDDQCIVIDRDGKGVVIELPCFDDNIAELTRYLEDQGIDVVAKLVSYHAAGSSFLPDVPSYLTDSAVEYNTHGEGYGLVTGFAKAFGEGFDAGIVNRGEHLEAGKFDPAGFEMVIVPNGDAYEVEVPLIRAVYMHMLGHDCHSIVAGPAHADAIIENLRRYLDEGYDLFLSAHYVPETREDVEAKIAYLEDLKSIAAGCGSAEGFTAAVNARYPGYSGANYLGMTAGLFFPKE